MPDLNIEKLAAELKQVKTWLVLGGVAFAGLFGGLAHFYATAPTDGQISLVGHLVVGAVAALSMLFLVAPDNAARLVALALVAGYAGQVILGAWEAQLKAAVAAAQIAQLKDDGRVAVETGKEAIAQAQALNAISREAIDELLKAKPQTNRAEVIGTLKRAVPPEAHGALEASPEGVAAELRVLSRSLENMNNRFR
jgi:hypothetical protein